jgi:hypothetical protein
MNHVGHILYDLLYERGETFSHADRFNTTESLFHFTSFQYLANLQEMYKVEEVRIAEVYIQGLTWEQTQEILGRMNEVDSPLSDFRLYGESALYS